MMTLQQIAELVDGVVIGDPLTQVSGTETIEAACCGDLTFAVDKKACGKLAESKASAAIVSHAIQNCPIPCVQCDEPQQAFTTVAQKLRPQLKRPCIGISDRAIVSATAKIAANVSIYPGAFVGCGTVIEEGTTVYPGVCILENCHIGRDVNLFPNAVLYENTKVGDRSNIHANAVVGAYGFGYDSSADGHKLSVQLGHVEIGSDVDVGACTTIDRGTFGTTRVGNGSKLDNQVMIGHNCQVGEHNLLCSQVGIAGSCQTGDFVVMAGQVGIGDHLAIGDHAIVGAKAGVMHNLEGGQTYIGAPALPARDKFQIIAAESKLPEMRKQFKKLQRKVDQLEGAVQKTNSADAA